MRTYVLPSVLFGVIMSALTLLAVTLTGTLSEYPVMLGLPVAYLALVTVLARRVRFASQCGYPLGLLHLHALIQGCLVPLSFALDRVHQGTLPFLPTALYINRGLILAGLSLVGLAIGIWLTPAPRGKERWKKHNITFPVNRDLVPNQLIVLYVFIGTLGFYLTFNDLYTLIDYYTRPATREDVVMVANATLAQVAGTFSRPFLVVGMCFLWIRLWNRRKAKPSPFGEILWLLLAVLPVIFLLTLSFGYNRGYFVSVIIAMIAIMQLRFGRPSAWSLMAVGLPIALALLILGSYRSSRFTTEELLRDTQTAEILYENINLSQTFQVYANGPQFSGFLMQFADDRVPAKWGSTLIASALSPVPVLGKAFRADSGPAIYNSIIYDDNVTLDQIISLPSELYLNFGYAGVLIGFILVGYVSSLLNNRFLRSQDNISAFSLAYFSYWVAFQCVASLSILAQVLIFFFPPIFLYRPVIKILGASVRATNLRPTVNSETSLPMSRT